MDDPGLSVVFGAAAIIVIVFSFIGILLMILHVCDNRANFHEWLKNAETLDFKLYEKEGKYRLFLNGCWVYWMYTNIIWVGHDLDAVEARKDKIKKLYAELKKPVPFWTEVNTKDES